MFLRARWFDPRSGRFVSKDPFPGYTGLPQTLKAYAYCLNNSINCIDPSGELPPWLIPVLVIGETLDPLPLDPLIWTLAAWLAVDTVRNAPGAVRAIGRLIDPPVRERTKTRPWRWWEGAPLAPENLPQRPTPPPVKTFDPWVPLPRSTPQPQTDPRLDPRLKPCPTVVTTPMPEQRVTVYRGLDAKKGRPVYSPSQFRYDPDGVSMFELQYLPDNKPFAAGFDFVISSPKVPGVVGQSKNIPGLTATYTPPPIGHWSVQHVSGAEYTKENLSSNARLKGAIPNPNWIGE